MISLNADEQREFNDLIKRISLMSKGLYYPRDLFPNNVPIPRVVRRLFEEVSAGMHPNIKLAGSKSEDGYYIV